MHTMTYSTVDMNSMHIYSIQTSLGWTQLKKIKVCLPETNAVTSSELTELSSAWIEVWNDLSRGVDTESIT